MFAPGMPRRTPGTMRVKLTKFRPLSGSVLIWFSTTVLPSSEDALWIRGAVPSTWTDSVTSPICKVRSARTFWSTPTGKFDKASFLNPAISAETVYVPGGRDGTTYSPDESLETVRVNPVSVFVINYHLCPSHHGTARILY